MNNEQNQFQLFLINKIKITKNICYFGFRAGVSVSVVTVAGIIVAGVSIAIAVAGVSITVAGVSVAVAGVRFVSCAPAECRCQSYKRLITFNKLNKNSKEKKSI